MKVLLAGASGAIGIPITRQLLAHHHQVLGLTRDRAGADRLAALGARPVLADALDRDGLLRAVDRLSADAVIHELTALHKPPLRHRGMALTNRLRSQGTTNLLAAAEALGARRFLTQSIILGYGYRDHGDRVLTEQDPFGHPAGDRPTRMWRPCCPPSSRRSAPPRASPCAMGCCTAGTPSGCGPCWPADACPWPGAACSAGSTTRTRPRPRWPPWSTAAPGRPTTWSMTCPPPGRRCTRRWPRRWGPHRRGRSRDGCSGWPPRTWPPSRSTPRCGRRTPRPSTSSAGSRRSPATTRAS